MKFVQLGCSHPRNEEAFIRGCLLFNIQYQKVDNASQITDSPDLIWSISTWIDPCSFSRSKILYGPQFFIFPSSDGPLSVCNSPDADSRCFYNCLSDWNIKIHNLFAPNPKIPYICLPFGVDTSLLKPDVSVKKDDTVLVYYKQRHSKDLDIVLSILEDNGLSYKLIKYGSYEGSDYHRLLRTSKICIWVGRHESQGFAFQETLSLGVPLLVYDVTDMKQEVNQHNQSAYANYSYPLPASAASYWDPICGEKTTNPYEIDGLLKKMLGSLDSYKPREFIERELSDTVCFKRLLDAFDFTYTE